MVKWIVGGVVTLIIGGASYTISQSSVVNNLSKNTGLSQQQAQQYINNIPQKDIESFSKAGQYYVSDGKTVLSDASSLDCANYTYPWVTPLLSCQDGVSQLQTAGNDEISLGHCFESLGTNLGNASNSTIKECISDINAVTSDYSLPVLATFITGKTLTNLDDTNAYNKAVLQAALQSN